MIAPGQTEALERVCALEDELDRMLLPDPRPLGPTPQMRAAEQSWQTAVWAAAEAAGPYPLDEETASACIRVARRPIFIVGVHRSGTTLVRDLLDGHPQLSVLPSEGSYLTTHRAKIEALSPAERPGFYARLWLERLVNPIHQPPYWMLGRSADAHSPYVEFSRRFLALWPLMQAELGRNTVLWPFLAIAMAYALCQNQVHPGSQAWVEKTPTNEAFADRLRRDFPAARFVHVLRDPYAVFASRKRLEERVSGTFTAASVCLRQMAQSYRIAAQHARNVDEDEYHLLRYEDLLADPETAMRGLARHLAIDWDGCLLHPTSAGMPAHSNSSFRSDVPPGAIVGTTAGSDLLTADERDLIAASAGDGARGLGYRVERVPLLRRRTLQTHAWIRCTARTVQSRMRGGTP